MSSNINDIKEYQSYTSDGVFGSVTRGIVVSNEDPLFSGRVKVWIPILHGGYTEDDKEALREITGVDPKIPGDDKTFTKAALIGTLTPEAIKMLPWAQVLGHNWGSVGRFTKSGVGKIDKINYGLFSTPRVGTEVMLVFEDDNPDRPIVLGSAIHKRDYLWNRKLTVEIIPGLRASAVEPKSDKEYPKEVANSLIIQAANGGKLLFSDSLDRETILLTAPILTVPKDSDKNKLKDQSVDYKIILDTYPAFPTTASSPYIGTPSGSTAIDQNGGKKTSAVLFDPPPPTPQSPTPGTVPADGSAPASPAAATDGRIEKTWPIEAAAQPTSEQMFGASRAPSGKHTGIDLNVMSGTSLLAPANGIVFGIYPNFIGQYILDFKGVDGSIHHFDGLESGDSANIGKKVTAGTKLGVCAGANVDPGVASGNYIHWDIVTDKTNLVTNADEARQFRQAHISGGIFKGTSIAADSFTDPSKWVTENSVTKATSDQLASIIDTTKAQEAFDNLPINEKHRNIGLEMSLITGRETIFLRHPSGSYMGFDVDGNFMLYTTGDANFKVNRSANWNVFGGFLVDCYTWWTKVSTVARLFASSFAHKRHIPDKEVDGADIPEFFKRNVRFKKTDMNDALAASKSNTWIIDNKTGQPIGTLAGDDYGPASSNPGGGQPDPGDPPPGPTPKTPGKFKMELRRKRVANRATVGELYINGVFECYTLEDVVREPGVKVYGETCIPAGTYKVIINMSPKFGKLMPRLLNVPGFDGILMHKGTKPEDTLGCILIGKTWDKTNNRIVGSGLAYDPFFEKLQTALNSGDTATITITNEF